MRALIAWLGLKAEAIRSRQTAIERLQAELLALQREHIALLRQQPGGLANLKVPSLGSPVRWSPEDEAKLIELRAQGLLIRQCAAQLNRSYTSVYQRWQVIRKQGRAGAAQ